MTRRRLHLLAVALLGFGTLAGCDRAPTGSPSSEESTAEGAAVPEEEESWTDYRKKVAYIDRRAAWQKSRIEEGSAPASRHRKLAALRLSRGRLTGDWRDFGEAEDQIDAAFREGLKPWLLRASLMVTLHRLDEAEGALEMAGGVGLPSDTPTAAIARLEGSIALQRGEFERARDHFSRSIEASPGPEALANLAHLERITGQPDRADDLLERALGHIRQSNDRLRAWIALQRGLVDVGTGDLEAALEHYRGADAEFSGWWLVEQRIAQVQARRGDHRKAAKIYAKILDDHDNPEVLSARAALVDEWDRDQARRLRERATEIWERRLEQHPEAAAAHAAEHFLSAGRLGEAHKLARRNAENRPGGADALLLARVLRATGRAERADEIVHRVEHSAYVVGDDPSHGHPH